MNNNKLHIRPYSPDETMEITYQGLIDAISDGTRSGIESERVSLAVKIDTLHRAAIDGNEHPEFIRGLAVAIQAISVAGATEVVWERD